MDAVVRYDVTDAAIAQMESIYMSLSITDLEDKEQFNSVHSARMVVKNHRVEVEKKRKELKASALEYGRKVDAEAKRITAKLEPIENHLTTEEKKVTDEQERRKREEAEKEERRVKEILALVETIKQYPGTITLSTVSGMISEMIGVIEEMPIVPEIYQEFIEIATATKADSIKRMQTALSVRLKFEEEEAARKAEADRLEKIRKEQEAEAARLAEEKRKIEEAQEVERKRIAAEQKAEADRLAEERRKMEEAQAAEKKKIADERAAFEAEKKAEQDRKDREALEKRMAEEAKAEAEREAKLWAERIEAEKIARAEREAEAAKLKPDKEKLEAWANTLLDISLPGGIQDLKILAIARRASDSVYVIANEAIDQVRAL